MPTLAVATFNLLNFTAPPAATYLPQYVYKAKDWAKKCAWLQRQLLRMDADIVGFQEVFSLQSLQQVTQAAGYPYLATVDAPRLRSGLIYDRPVVALASRWPLARVEALPYAVLGSDLPLPGDFSFSRTPLLVEVKTPYWSEPVTCVVLHLKSPRALLKEAEIAPFRQWPVYDELAGGSLTCAQQGHVLSTWQRGAEACLVRQAVAAMPQPVMVLGDMNDAISSLSGQALCGQALRFNAEGIQAAANEYEPVLWDSQSLSEQVHSRPTYYHRREALYLDYILLNQALRERVTVQQYRVFDRHLSRNRDGSIRKSDHAQVKATLAL